MNTRHGKIYKKLEYRNTIVMGRFTSKIKCKKVITQAGNFTTTKISMFTSISYSLMQQKN